MGKVKGSRAEAKGATRIQRGLEEGGGWWNRVLDLSLMWAVLAILGCTWLLLPRVGSRLPDWEPGEVAAFDVMAPRDMTLPDEAATEAVRQEARDAVLPIYDVEPRVQVELAEEIYALFAACSELAGSDILSAQGLADASELRIERPMLDVIVASNCAAGLEQALVDVLAQVYRDRVVDDKHALERRGERGVVVRNLSTNVEQTRALEEFSAGVDVRSGLESAVRTRLAEQDAVARRWIKPTVDFLSSNMTPSMVFSRAETVSRVQAAADQITPRSQVFRKGQVLIRRGDTVSFAAARTLRVINRQRRDLVSYASMAGIGLLMMLMMVGWWRILGRFSIGTVDLRSHLSMIFILVLLFVAINRLGLFIATAVALNSQGQAMSSLDAYLWALPYAAGPVTVLMLFGLQPAVLFAVCSSLMAGVMLGGDFSVVVYSLVSGLVGVLAAQQFKDRAAFTRVAVLVGLANVAAFAILKIYAAIPEEPKVVVLSAFFALLGGAVTVLLVNFLLPLFESLFGITTDIRLLELSNQNLPLLKRLSLEAPGTYQHSLAVGNLAEAGADVVGANGLLLRVCAYYHDLGKLVKPEYFVENQRGANPHDSLSPSMSALVIQSHVKEGLEMARKEKLPLPIRQAVATHHGTKLIRYFYNKAQEQCDPDVQEVRESNYRYPGPKPHTKELGILLLADAVEAAARTLENPAPSKIQAMINRILTDALEDGQLDDSDLTFSELDKVASAFMWVLTNMYHHRIDYPGFDFNRRQEKRESGAVQVATKTVTAER